MKRKQSDTMKLPKDFWLWHWMTFEELYEAVGKGLPKKH